MTRALRVGMVAATAAVLALSITRMGNAHPLHTTMAELSYDASARVLAVSLRVFADDFAAAVAGTPVSAGGAKPGDPLPPAGAMHRYVTERFGILAPGARAIPLEWCGVQKAGETLLLCLRARGVAAPSGATVRSSLMVERFDDQVNMVKASFGGRKSMLLFTRRDGGKTLR